MNGNMRAYALLTSSKGGGGGAGWNMLGAVIFFNFRTVMLLNDRMLNVTNGIDKEREFLSY